MEKLYELEILQRERNSIILITFNMLESREWNKSYVPIPEGRIWLDFNRITLKKKDKNVNFHFSRTAEGRPRPTISYEYG